MSIERVDYFSVSLEDHNLFGKRVTLILNLLNLSCVQKAILVQEHLGNPLFYDIAYAFTLLRRVERLVIESKVGPKLVNC